jgi:hypothetical protein
MDKNNYVMIIGLLIQHVSAIISLKLQLGQIAAKIIEYNPEDVLIASIVLY